MSKVDLDSLPAELGEVFATAFGLTGGSEGRSYCQGGASNSTNLEEQDTGPKRSAFAGSNGGIVSASNERGPASLRVRRTSHWDPLAALSTAVEETIENSKWVDLSKGTQQLEPPSLFSSSDAKPLDLAEGLQGTPSLVELADRTNPPFPRLGGVFHELQSHLSHVRDAIRRGSTEPPTSGLFATDNGGIQVPTDRTEVITKCFEHMLQLANCDRWDADRVLTVIRNQHSRFDPESVGVWECAVASYKSRLAPTNNQAAPSIEVPADTQGHLKELYRLSAENLRMFWWLYERQCEAAALSPFPIGTEFSRGYTKVSEPGKGSSAPSGPTGVTQPSCNSQPTAPLGRKMLTPKSRKPKRFQG